MKWDELSKAQRGEFIVWLREYIGLDPCHVFWEAAIAALYEFTGRCDGCAYSRRSVTLPDASPPACSASADIFATANGGRY